jgi:hypothetical protein
MVAHKSNYRHCKTYYKKARNDIIKQKTFKKAATSGRVPRMDTILTHNIDLKELCSILQQLKASNEDKERTISKIDRFLKDHDNQDNMYHSHNHIADYHLSQNDAFANLHP